MTPTQRGFDSFYGFYTGVINYNTHEHSLTKELGGRDYRRVTVAENGNNNEVLLNEKVGNHTTGDFTREAVEIIKNFKNDSNRLFLTVSYNAPHFPWITNNSLPDSYTDVPALDLEHSRRTYLNLITELDQGVNQIREALVENNMWENRKRDFTVLMINER